MAKQGDGNFFKSSTFLAMELILIAGVITAILTQIILIVIQLFTQLKESLSKCKRKNSSKCRVAALDVKSPTSSPLIQIVDSTAKKSVTTFKMTKLKRNGVQMR
jgi:hypothetical protein